MFALLYGALLTHNLPQIVIIPTGFQPTAGEIPSFSEPCIVFTFFFFFLFSSQQTNGDVLIVTPFELDDLLSV